MVTVPGSSQIQSIVNPVSGRGIGFTAKRDLSLWAPAWAVRGSMRFLRTLFFEETVTLAKTLSFFSFPFAPTSLITLETADSAHVGASSPPDA